MRKKLLILLALSYLILLLVHFFYEPYPEHGDTIWHVEMAKKYSFTDPGLFSHGQWPGGYPAFLRFCILILKVHPVYAGRFLSLIAGLIILGSVIGITSRISNRNASLMSLILLLGNTTFLNVSMMEGTDMPAASLQFLSLYLLVKNYPERCRHRDSIMSGVILGLSYLFRFTAVIFLPLFSIYGLTRGKKSVVSMLLVILGFSILASPQLVSTYIERGNPFANDLGRNIWLGEHGKYNPGLVWQEAPPDYSPIDKLRDNPRAYISYWIGEIGGFIRSGTSWPLGIAVLTVIASVVFAIQRHEIWIKIVILGATWGPLCAIALAFFVPRHGLVPIVGLSLIGGLAFGECKRKYFTPIRFPRVLAVVAIVLSLFLLSRSFSASFSDPSLRFAGRLNKTIKDMGVEDVHTVATNIGVMVDTESRWLDQYDILSGIVAPSNIRDLFSQSETSENWEYLLIDYNDFWGDFSPIREEANRGGSKLVPIYREDTRELYRIRPDADMYQSTANLRFHERIELVGCDWTWRDENISIQAYWRTTDSISEDYETVVDLIMDNGDIRYMESGMSEKDTYPISAWSPGKIIVDSFWFSDIEVNVDSLTVHIGVSKLDTDVLPEERARRMVLCGSVYRTGKGSFPKDLWK